MVIPKEIHLLGPCPMPRGCVAVLEAAPQLDDKGAVLGSDAGSEVNLAWCLEHLVDVCPRNQSH